MDPFEDDEDLEIQDDDGSESEDEYDVKIQEAHEKFKEQKAQEKASRPRTAPRPESPTSAKERSRIMERVEMIPRDEVSTPRRNYVPRPQSASAACDRRMRLDIDHSVVWKGLDPSLESRIQAQIQGSPEPGAEGRNLMSSAMDGKGMPVLLASAPVHQPTVTFADVDADLEGSRLLDDVIEEDEDDEEAEVDQIASVAKYNRALSSTTPQQKICPPMPALKLAGGRRLDDDDDVDVYEDDEADDDEAEVEPMTVDPRPHPMVTRTPARVPGVTMAPAKAPAPAAPAPAPVTSGPGSMRTRALADLTEDLNSLLLSSSSSQGMMESSGRSAALSGGGGGGGGAPALGSHHHANTGHHATKRSNMTLGMRGHLGLNIQQSGSSGGGGGGGGTSGGSSSSVYTPPYSASRPHSIPRPQSASTSGRWGTGQDDGPIFRLTSVPQVFANLSRGGGRDDSVGQRGVERQREGYRGVERHIEE